MSRNRPVTHECQEDQATEGGTQVMAFTHQFTYLLLFEGVCALVPLSSHTDTKTAMSGNTSLET